MAGGIPIKIGNIPEHSYGLFLQEATYPSYFFYQIRIHNKFDNGFHPRLRIVAQGARRPLAGRTGPYNAVIALKPGTGFITLSRRCTFLYSERESAPLLQHKRPKGAGASGKPLHVPTGTVPLLNKKVYITERPSEGCRGERKAPAAPHSRGCFLSSIPSRNKDKNPSHLGRGSEKCRNSGIVRCSHPAAPWPAGRSGRRSPPRRG